MSVPEQIPGGDEDMAAFVARGRATGARQWTALETEEFAREAQIAVADGYEEGYERTLAFGQIIDRLPKDPRSLSHYPYAAHATWHLEGLTQYQDDSGQEHIRVSTELTLTKKLSDRRKPLEDQEVHPDIFPGLTALAIDAGFYPGSVYAKNLFGVKGSRRIGTFGRQYRSYERQLDEEHPGSGRTLRDRIWDELLSRGGLNLHATVERSLVGYPEAPPEPYFDCAVDLGGVERREAHILDPNSSYRSEVAHQLVERHDDLSAAVVEKHVAAELGRATVLGRPLVRLATILQETGSEVVWPGQA